MIPNIFIEIPINKARKVIKQRLYIQTGIHFVFAISSLIFRARKFFQKRKNKIYHMINRPEIIVISVILINKILQKRKLNISSWRLQRKPIKKIPQPIPACEIISFVDSLLIKFVCSIKYMRIAHMMAKRNQ
jgi:hypothetical protein